MYATSECEEAHRTVASVPDQSTFHNPGSPEQPGREDCHCCAWGSNSTSLRDEYCLANRRRQYSSLLRSNVACFFFACPPVLLCYTFVPLQPSLRLLLHLH